MQTRLLSRGAALVVIAAGLGTAALAQTAKAPAAPDWSQTVTKETGAGVGELDAKQQEIVQKLTAYFNQMGDTKGDFTQISADGKRLRGKIYIKRPNFFRFEYNRPSRQLIISDGQNMIIQDLDLKTDDRWGLDRTPFRIVLRKDVDLMRDAKVLEVGESDSRFFILLQDKDANTAGKLKLVFLKQPVIELREWVTTDSQGQDTKVELTDFVRADNLDPDLFKPTAVALDKLRQ